jgi:hypothetical protein
LIYVFLLFFALSHKITWAGQTLVELKLNHYLLASLAPFRSSGRFFWPVYYGLIFFPLALIIKRYKRAVSISVILLALMIQFLDFHRAFGAFDAIRSEEQKWDNPLKSEFWSDIEEKYEKILLVPPLGCDTDVVTYYVPFAYIAAKQDLSINSFYLARFNYQKTSKYCERLLAEIREGTIDHDAIYILDDKHLQLLKGAPNDPVECLIVDGFNVCYVKK